MVAFTNCVLFLAQDFGGLQCKFNILLDCPHFPALPGPKHLTCIFTSTLQVGWCRAVLGGDEQREEQPGKGSGGT